MAIRDPVPAFQHIVDTYLEEFVVASSAIGEPLTTLAHLVRNAFRVELYLITDGVNSLRPNDDASYHQMTQPLYSVINEIQDYRNKNRSLTQFFDHLSAVSESIVALNWLSTTPAPTQFVKDFTESGQYYGNRVLVANKGNIAHTDWINKYYAVLKALESYVREYHRTGFTWGIMTPAPSHIPCGDGPPPCPAPPPCQAPPPPPPRLAMAEDTMSGGEDRHALFSQINQGDSIVQMLKPVQERGAPTSRTGPEVGHADRAASASRIRTYPPKFLLDGKKWRIEHQKDNFGMVINNEDMSESLAMFKCDNAGVHVYNKMNGVTIDSCKGSTVVLNDIISSVEAIRCDRLKIQCIGHIPLISIDNCDSVQIFVTSKSEDVEIISSKSTSCNVCLLAPDGDYVELPMPEQIRTVIVNRALRSTVVEKV